MDLTKEYPASVREKLHGVVQLRRTLDKGKASAQGNIGEYHYNCPMDQAIFAFLGLDHEKVLDVIKKSKSDQEIIDYVKPFIAKKQPAEIEKWNHEWLAHRPDSGSDGEKYFLNLRADIEKRTGTQRPDIVTWPDVLDFDEKREVPRRQTAAASA